MRKLPTQERAKATVEAVLAAAAQVFSSEGYAAGTTNRVAERAGVSIGTLYQYFPNKDALLVALVQRHIDEANAMIERLLTQAWEEPAPLKEQLRRFIAAMVALHTREPELHRVIFEQAPHPAALIELLRKVEDASVEAIEALLTAMPEVRVQNARAAAWMLVQTVEALTHRYVLYPPRDVEEDAFVAEVTSMLWRYLSGDLPQPA